MKTKFLFMDESRSPKIRQDGTFIASLTGIIIPVEDWVVIREDFIKSISSLCIKTFADGTKMSIIPEMHGRKMLPDGTDEQKIRVFKEIAKLTSKYKFPIYRCGYFINTKKDKDLLEFDKYALGLTWIKLLEALQPEFQDNLLIPIMDSLEPQLIETFSGTIKGIIWSRTNLSTSNDDIFIKNTQNIIGEVFFADSRFSALTQIVDVISYLRCINDEMREGHQFTKFKENLYECNQFLKEQIKYDSIMELPKQGVGRGFG